LRLGGTASLAVSANEDFGLRETLRLMLDITFLGPVKLL
jgi:hypothetical protein